MWLCFRTKRIGHFIQHRVAEQVLMTTWNLRLKTQQHQSWFIDISVGYRKHTQLFLISLQSPNCTGGFSYI